MKPLEKFKIDCNEYIGVVSRQLPSIITLSEAKVHAITECDEDVPVGSYLIIESGNRRYLAKVVESSIQDIYAIARTPVLSLEQELMINVKTLPKLVSLELIAECIGNDCTVAITPVPIHSLVRKPKSGEVSELLQLPRDGVIIGNLALPNGLILNDENVYLPLSTLRHHVLIVGTTGSGKTVFTKNLIYEILKNNLGKILVLDVVGHYHHLVSSEVSEIAILYPLTTRKVKKLIRNLRKKLKLRSNKDDIKIIVRHLAGKIVKDYLESTFSKFGINYELKGVHVDAIYSKVRKIIIIKSIEIYVKILNYDVKIYIYPWALEIGNVIYSLPTLSMVFTSQARIFYKRIIDRVVNELINKKIEEEIKRRIEMKYGKEYSALLRDSTISGKVKEEFHEISKELKKNIEDLDIGDKIRYINISLNDIYEHLLSSKTLSPGKVKLMYEIIADEIGVHKGTVENIVRGLLSLVETDLFDVNIKIGEYCLSIVESNYGEVFKHNYVIVDLRDIIPQQQRLIVYRVLDKLYKYVNIMYSKGKVQNVIIAIDEAHTFFPQTREESEKEIIEHYLTRLARLGRARGIGLVFATHSPDDLNDLVLQLANTKIILRSDEKILEKLGIPAGERRILVSAPSGLALIRSFTYKIPILVKIHKPKTIHIG